MIVSLFWSDSKRRDVSSSVNKTALNPLFYRRDCNTQSEAGHKSFIVNCASISPPISMEVVFQLSPEIPFRFNPKPLTFSNRSRIDFCRPLSATSDSRSRNRMFVLGMGFVGGFVAEKLKEADCHPPNPKTQSAKLRLAAEEGWLSLGSDLGVSTHVLRLGGIYGPARSAIDTLLKQQHLSESQLRRASRRFTSRVHVEDICQALQASIEKPSSREIYNIVDDDPAPREEVFQYALELIEKRWKRKIETKPFLYESREQSSLRGEKRVSNEHMKNKLGVKLLHPSYKSGLQSIGEKMDNPF
ncbi:hypothetical protein DY000_02045886 [Brassica cretica]|uniref:NAD-dependent epimerase/dehydratase domain-containing protein n=1 Tax=Brassica cretica TaxID=69181 RepID=A0ABQ7EPB8_BRACR|nr:hypothetical protein DY000_02045886 [Brassica cretica]